MRAKGNLQDFYNLVDVYIDAVLHPKCIDDEHTFAQEGWHYELEDPKAGHGSPHAELSSCRLLLCMVLTQICCTRRRLASHKFCGGMIAS